MELAEKTPYDGKLLRGKLGSGDLFSRETDRIDLLHTQFGELCEDMESAAVYKVCQTFHVPVIGIRIISNNEITGKHDDPGAISNCPIKNSRITYINISEN